MDEKDKKIEQLEKSLIDQSNRERTSRNAATKWMKRCFDMEQELREMRKFKRVY